MLSRFRTWYVSGISDSPMWKRGKCSRSRRRTFLPCWASSVAAVEPLGPPPMTMTSISLAMECLKVAGDSLVGFTNLLQEAIELLEGLFVQVAELPAVAVAHRSGQLAKQA